MKHWIGLFSLWLVGIPSVFADGLNHDKNNQSTTAILLGVLILTIIILMLIRRQKRRFND